MSSGSSSPLSQLSGSTQVQGALLTEEQVQRRDQEAVRETNLNDAPVPEWVNMPLRRGPQPPVHMADFIVGEVEDDGRPGIHNNLTVDDVREQTNQINEHLAHRTRLQVESLRRTGQEIVAANHETDARLRQSRIEMNNSMRRIEEAMRTSQLAQSAMSRYRQAQLEAPAGGTISEMDERRARENALTYLERQAEFRQRYHAIDATSRDANANEPTSPATSASGTSVVAAVRTAADPASNTGQVPSARRDRDLERALRDYRIARNALTGNGPNSSVNRQEPPYLGLLGPNSLNLNSRNQTRILHQARSNAWDRTDAFADRLAATARADPEVWGNSEVANTVVGTPNLSNQQRGFAGIPPIRGFRNTLPADAPATADPYLGPNSSARGNSSAPGGMRNFYRRLEQRERTNPRATTEGSYEVNLFGDAPVIFPPAGFAGGAYARPPQTMSNTTRSTDERLPAHQPVVGTSPRDTKEKARRILRYLSQLKELNNDGEKATDLAKQLGIDRSAESLAQGVEIDLPLRINELPEPQYSSWLEAGMSWTGMQRGGFAKSELPFDINEGTLTFDHFVELDGPGSPEQLAAGFVGLRNRERVRAERYERYRIFTNQGPTVLAREQPRGLLTDFANNPTATLADVQRHLNDLLIEEQERMTRDGFNDWSVAGVTFHPRPATGTETAANKQTEDEWPVMVTIHEVDMRKKTVTGSMVASQIPTHVATAVAPMHRSADASNNDDEKQDTSLSMKTYFDGEIIDFRTFEFETVGTKPGYTIGGVGTDLKYWSRIGPFKEEARKRIEAARDAKAALVYARMGLNGTRDEQREQYRRATEQENNVAEELNKDEADAVIYNTMFDCLGSRKWLDKAMGEGGWIFMRWKERYFDGIPPSGPPLVLSAAVSTDDQTHSQTGPRGFGFPLDDMETHTTTRADDDRRRDPRAWSFTIRGFYYVALNRMSGKIEALYYDTGSRPYQELACHPVGSKVIKIEKTEKNEENEEVEESEENGKTERTEKFEESEKTQETKDTEETEGNGEADFDNEEIGNVDVIEVGIRREFPAIEFR